MRQIIELKNKINDREFFLSQFDKSGEKNILFVNPNLGGKQLYRSILPYIKLPQMLNVATAITSLDSFGVREQLMGYKPLSLFSPENDNEDKIMMVKWATVIVFPATIQPLKEIYDHIRSINPNVKILYSIDFNYWLMPEDHPLKELFNDDMMLEFIEDNIYFSDSVLVSNQLMQAFLIKRMGELVETRYRQVERNAVNEIINVRVLPLLIDEDIVLDNVEFSTENLIFKVPLPEENEVEGVSDKKEEVKPKTGQQVVKKVHKPKITSVNNKKKKRKGKGKGKGNKRKKR